MNMTRIQLQEKEKRRRNAGRGRKCGKGTMPQVYNILKEPVQEAPQQTWFGGLRARIKALWQRGAPATRKHQAPGS